MEPGAEHQQQLRSLRDFLLVYNRMTELCFRHCVSNLNYRLLTGREPPCRADPPHPAGDVPRQLRRQAGPLQPPPDECLCGPDAFHHAAPRLRLRGRRSPGVPELGPGGIGGTDCPAGGWGT
ncbi:mitochondrial import inner membrane translocase subunit Tim10 B isoform X2 [Calonectris borealis]|uniref:mitochondrial import inner membrane translocase subunit Tim10 B isoform X2 n=1 Tax=Calonectris borealis TaxID=1323832 RepID=UPI003F4B746C